MSKRVEKGTVAQKVIRIACTGAAMMPLKEIVALQGGLKELSVENYEKLKGLIVKHGFSFPLGIAVIKGKPYGVIDGHQRDRVVKQMVGKEGYALPGGKLPVYWIECKDRAEAGRKILAAVSQFGKVTDDGLYQFAHDFKIDADELKTDFDLPDFDMEEFVDGFLVDKEAGDLENCEYPIVAKFNEKYDYVLIFCKNEIDFVNLQAIMKLRKQNSYKQKSVGVGRVIPFEEFEKLWNSR